MGPLAEDMGKRFTYAEYCTWDDEQRWELIDGVPYNMTPAPATRHQRISSNIHLMISEFLRGKQCVPFYAPTDVVFDEHNVVQPDLLVVCDREKITEANIQGAPDLVIEILSPATGRKDRREKKALYERFGVREYIVLDPFNETVERLSLTDCRYGPPDVFGWDETMRFVVLPELELELWSIFEKEKTEAVNERYPGYITENS
ncbi:MAG: Uma2 family endonuclease [Geobacteraceae bacterium]|nr:Uma2 family endonuclease [Geobacteraceae bacterium]